MSEAYEEAFNLLCDQIVGRGMSRVVYTSLLLPQYVVKVEESACKFEGRVVYQNINEWETWKHAECNAASRWFARVAWISPNGKVLVMEKTRPPADHELPDKLPVFFRDLKRSNFGMVEGKAREGCHADKDQATQWFVCHDYGILENVALYGLANKKMITMDWGT